MVVFVVDKGLNVLLSQIDEQAPNRSKKSDGSVGDPEHAERESDHNPEDTEDSSDGNDPDNQVDARDFTHDPANGADMHEISEAIRVSRDRRVLYVIFDGRIFSSYAVNGVPAWTWRTYTGKDKHRGHMHVSVVDEPNDYTAPWSITMALTPEDAKLFWNQLLGSSGPEADTALQETYRNVLTLMGRPPVVPAPVDPNVIKAAVVAAMASPEVKAIIKSVLLDPEVKAALD